MINAPHIIAVCGLKREAAMLQRFGAQAILSGGDAKLLRARLDALGDTCASVISAGICGALSPELKVGDCVVAEAIIADGRRMAADTVWHQRIASRLPEATVGVIAGSDSMLVDAQSKAALQVSTRAIAADMESHVAASFAAERGYRFAAVRVVSDQADVALPPAVLTAMASDGSIALGAVLKSLAKNPAQLPALIRTAGESEMAFRALFRCLGRLGSGLMGPDVG